MIGCIGPLVRVAVVLLLFKSLFEVNETVKVWQILLFLLIRKNLSISLLHFKNQSRCD